MDDILCHWYVVLLQRHIWFSELTDVKAITEGGFGVIHHAKHHAWGTVVYKELKSSIINDSSRFENYILCCIRSNQV